MSSDNSVQCPGSDDRGQKEHPAKHSTTRCGPGWKREVTGRHEAQVSEAVKNKHLTMSGDIFGCHIGCVLCWHLLDRGQDAQLPAMRNYPIYPSVLE